MTLKNYLFILVLFSAFAIFGWTAARIVRALKLGKPEHRFDSIGKRLENVISIAFFQSKIIREPLAGLVHIGIFWGFLTLLVVIAESIGEGIWTPFSLAFLGPLYNALALVSDVMGLIVLCSVLIALLRRYVFGPARVKDIPATSQMDATIILAAIAIIMITMLFANAFRIAMGASPHFAAGWRPVSLSLASMFGKSPQTAFFFEIFWWLHIVFVLGLLNYLPYSKHFHVITSIPNVFFSNKGIHPEGDGALKPLDLEDESAEKFGVTDIEDLTWKQLFDSYTCTECGRCTAACPANLTGKLLSPKKIITDTRARFKEKAPLLIGGATDAPALETQLLHNYISAEELWACTTCRACVQECPVMIEHVDEIVDLRRAMVLTESEFPELLQVLYRNLENNFAPWQFSPDDRAKWAEGMDIPQLSELGSAENVDYLFWVGCAGSYDARYKKVSVAFAKIMQRAGLRFAILGTEEKCNGDAARRTGNEYLAQMLMKENIELMNSYHVTNIVTACPHCLHTLKNEFPQFGGRYNVIHHSELIRTLLDSGILGFDTLQETNVTFHDSCYLGRYNDIYDDPREALRHVPGLKLVEMPRSRDKGLCCGAGGGQMFMEETVGKRVNIERTEEALGMQTDTIASACPFCMTMLTDGVKEKGKLEDVAVKDIAEVVYDALRK
jgi:Fe-S oxidoreductase